LEALDLERVTIVMVHITAIHLVGGVGHEHIASVQWRNPIDQQTGQNSRAEMVDWIDTKHGDARVTNGRTEVRVVSSMSAPRTCGRRPTGHGPITSWPSRATRSLSAPTRPAAGLVADDPLG
jgi:hypothetical protein